MIVKETDLHKPILDFFIEQGYSVHCEVNSIDMVAQRNDEIIAVELKCHLNFDLLLQATQRQRYIDSVYIAVPHPKMKRMSTTRWKKSVHLVKRLELGLLAVWFDKRQNALVEVLLHPEAYKPKLQRSKQRSIIREISGRTINCNVAGSHKVKIVTAYREKAVFIACCLEKFGPLSPSQLKRLGTAKNTQSILQKNFFGWFERLQRGIYHLHPLGKQGLTAYQDLVDYYREKIENVTV